MTLFSRIIKGEIPSYCCGEDDRHYAFLDIHPVTRGHVLVVTKREEDYFFDLSDAELAEIMAFSKRMAKAIKDVFPCKKVGVAVMGLEVDHVHVHLAPLQAEVDMDFGKEKLSLPAEEMADIAQRIRTVFEEQSF